MTKKRIIILIVCIAAVIAAVWFGIARFSGSGSVSEEGVSYAFRDADGCPDGWEAVSYEGKYEISASEGAVTLTSAIADDLRIVKTVPCEGGSVYVFSGFIKAGEVEDGRGASLSVDNYAIDKSCVYSEAQQGDTDWVFTELCFKTMPEQKELRLALRLGGYSEASSGSASFKEIAFRRDDTRTDYVTLYSWGDSAEENEDIAVWDSEKLKAMFAVMEWAAVLAGCFWIFCIYRDRERIESLSIGKKQFKVIFGSILCAGLLIRLILCAVFRGHDTDMSCFIAWGQNIASEGTSSFYTAAGHEWYDYPPAYMLFLGLWSRVINIFIANTYSTAGLFLYLVPAIAADYGCARLLMKTAEEQGLKEGAQLLIGGFTFLNPALLYLSGAWGQIDSILTFLLLCSFLLLLKEKRVWSGFVFGLAAVTKWQALMFGPVYAAAHIVLACLQDDGKAAGRKLGETGLAALAAFGTILLVSLPFKGSQELLWIVPKFLSAASGYDYASVEAYNYMALCGGNWVKASERVTVLPFTYKQMGIVFIVLALFIGIMLLIAHTTGEKSSAQKREAAGRAVILSAALTMALIFTFGHYMHERYVIPVILFTLLAYLLYRDKRLLLAAMLFTLTTFLNEMTAMFVVSNAAASVVRGGALHTDIIQICSLAEVCTCIYFIRVCFSLTAKAMPEREEEA